MAKPCATMAGLYRIVGHVTDVPIHPLAWAPIAPSVIQAAPEWPWLACQGWKWSLVASSGKPEWVARAPRRTMSGAVNCSWDRT